MDLEKLTTELQKFGFTKAQAKLYLAGLSLKRALMLPLARAAGIKRTTAIYLMGELLRRGFFARKKIGKRAHYIAAEPQKLLVITRERERLIKKLLPSLQKVSK